MHAPGIAEPPPPPCGPQVRQQREQGEEQRLRMEADVLHGELLARQKQRAALRQRIQQDAERAKLEQLKKIEAVAQERARQRGLGQLGLDPNLLDMSGKFSKVGQLVDEVSSATAARRQARPSEPHPPPPPACLQRRMPGPLALPAAPSCAMTWRLPPPVRLRACRLSSAWQRSMG